MKTEKGTFKPCWYQGESSNQQEYSYKISASFHFSLEDLEKTESVEIDKIGHLFGKFICNLLVCTSYGSIVNFVEIHEYFTKVSGRLGFFAAGFIRNSFDGVVSCEISVNFPHLSNISKC